ncbi:hypothetical protein BB559_006935 [Furculomyces boomerangus]|uniref:Uncharacterized protein n=1 Tax=Furculomyces boomerangus TaxID=61424 RepID=A0A2T9XZQ7_9FUNG|nr:hypothetical protein BB559_006935 [Furculomyces boomerangus]
MKSSILFFAYAFSCVNANILLPFKGPKCDTPIDQITVSNRICVNRHDFEAFVFPGTGVDILSINFYKFLGCDRNKENKLIRNVTPEPNFCYNIHNMKLSAFKSFEFIILKR